MVNYSRLSGLSVGTPLLVEGKRGEIMNRWLNEYKNPVKVKDNNLWSADPYKVLFDKAIAELNKDYPADVLTFIKNYHKQLYDAIDESEKKLDQLWGEAPIDEFREELKTFYKLNRKAVRIYQNK